jgi:hypothetical protein
MQVNIVSDPNILQQIEYNLKFRRMLWTLNGDLHTKVAESKDQTIKNFNIQDLDTFTDAKRGTPGLNSHLQDLEQEPP